jgi:two-component system response regulator
MSQPFNILLAEDDPDEIFFIKQALKKCVWTSVNLQVTHNYEQTLTFLQESLLNTTLPDLMLLDWNMPLLGGSDVLKALRKEPRFNLMPVVVLTGSYANDDVRHAYELGARSFITRPFEFGDLVEIVSRVKAYWADTVRLPNRMKNAACP